MTGVLSAAVLEVDVGEQLVLVRENHILPPPPSTSTALLLLGLCQAQDAWSDRAFLAQALYPDAEPLQARAALRQTLRRLRMWVGEDTVEAAVRSLRLVPGAWTLRFDPALDRSSGRGGLLPAIEHPWMDALRRQWIPDTPSAHPSIWDSFAGLVAEAAEGDPDVARSLLVGGRLLALRIPPNQLFDLVGRVRPRDRRDSHALEYLLLLAEMFHRNGQWEQSTGVSLRALRLAQHRRSRAHALGAIALAIFSLCEWGQMGRASEMSRELEVRLRLVQSHGEAANAKACLLWNQGDLDGALANMEAIAKMDPQWDRCTRLHFWTNFAVLAGESRQLNLATDCFAEVQRLVIPAQDLQVQATITVAQARLFELQGEPASGVKVLEAEVRRVESTGWTCDLLYLLEALAEMEARSGRPDSASATWKRYKALRIATGSRPNPRFFLRQAAVFAR